MSELLKINVNEHTEKKGGLTYLSWAWAWAEVLKVDPAATWVVLTYGGGEEPFMRVGETAMVHTAVTINGLRRECMLPVMDNRNNAVKNPDARKISDAIMRCMTKAIAMHGLGLYIYAGEDLPEGDSEESLVPVLEASIAQAKAKAKKTGVMADVLADMPPATPEEAEYIAELAENVKDLFKSPGPSAAFARVEADGLDNEQKIRLWALLPSNVRSALKKEGEARKVPA